MGDITDGGALAPSMKKLGLNERLLRDQAFRNIIVPLVDEICFLSGAEVTYIGKHKLLLRHIVSHRKFYLQFDEDNISLTADNTVPITIDQRYQLSDPKSIEKVVRTIREAAMVSHDPRTHFTWHNTTREDDSDRGICNSKDHPENYIPF